MREKNEVNVLQDKVNVLNTSVERFQCNRLTMVDVYRSSLARAVNDFRSFRRDLRLCKYKEFFIRREFRLHSVLQADIPMDVLNVSGDQNVHASASFGTSIAELATQCPLGWKRTLTRIRRWVTFKVGTSFTDPAI